MNDSTKDPWAQYPPVTDTRVSKDRDPVASLIQGAQVESIPSGTSGDTKWDRYPEIKIDPLPAGTGTVLRQGVVGGGIQGAGVTGGMVTGAIAGSPAGPWGSAVGAVIGAGVGAYGGYKVREAATEVDVWGEPLTFLDVEELPEELRPYGYASEAAGMGLAPMGAPKALSVLGVRGGAGKIGQWINGVIDTAVKYPGAYAATELSSIASSAIAEGVAEEYFPGNSVARIGAGVTAGVLNPTKYGISFTKATISRFKKAFETMTPAGRETRLARVLQQVVADAGEDPELLIKMLNETDVPELQEAMRTAAQKTGSPAFGAIEKSISNYSAKFGAKAKKMSEDSIKVIRLAIRALHGTGDPVALKEASNLRSELFNHLLSERLRIAEQEALEYAGTITKDLPEAKSQLSKIMSGAVEDVFKTTRNIESELWDKVPKDLSATANEVLKQYAEIMAHRLPDDKLKSLIEKTIKRWTQAKGEVSLQDLTNLRSTALAMMREESAKGGRNAYAYGELAEAALDDLEIVFNRQKDIWGAGYNAYEEATQFSKNLNDVFTRTFVGKALVKGRYGRRIPAELVAKRALVSGGEAGALQMDELAEATQFLVKQGRGNLEHLNLMMDAQDRMLRIAASDSINDAGEVSVPKLTTFIKRHAELLERFPEVKSSLKRAINSEKYRQHLVHLNDKSQKAVEKQAAFYRVMKSGEKTTKAIYSALDGNYPKKDLDALIRLAKRGGDDAIEGLKITVYDAVVDRATDASGTMSLSKLKELLTTPVSAGNPSLIDIMTEGGIITPEDLALTKHLFTAAKKIEDVLAGGMAIDEIGDVPGFLAEFIAKISSVSIAGWVLSKLPKSGIAGHGLVLLGAASRLGQKLFNKLPQTQLRQLAVEVVSNPKLMALMLAKPKTEKEAISAVLHLHAYLVHIGYTFTQEDVVQDAVDTFESANSRVQTPGDSYLDTVVSSPSSGVVPDPQQGENQ